jgi:KUP system potassium uptake protein
MPSANGSILQLSLGSIGVVFGDIGTSPLYTFRQGLGPSTYYSSGAVATAEVYGVLSLILWALILIVTCKYVLVLLRVDDHGEGGVLALMALARRVIGPSSAVLFFGIIGTALFFGDGFITPAVSVLSAVEGLKIEAPALAPLVVPVTLVILVALFAIQSRGTARVAAFFGPIMLLWFATIAVAAVPLIIRHPEVLLALNPLRAISFMLDHRASVVFSTLGAIFLAVTGAEAIYADLGHFGRRPIQTAWLLIVLPSLMLNYMGQAAIVISDPKAIENPFYLMFPDWALKPVIGIATLATVIASQAVITAVHSLARQAIQLGLLPRLEVRHTSTEHEGQIYLPLVNTILLVVVVILVLMFSSSDALASAYGIAVSGVMLVTTCLAFLVSWKIWKWSLFLVTALTVPFFVIEAIFLAANLTKLPDGGWLPITLAAALSIVMYTWLKGTRLLSEKIRRQEIPLDDLVKMLDNRPPHRVSGTAVYLTSDPNYAPVALLHMLKHYKVLHEHNVILAVLIESTPRVPREDRVKIEPIGLSFSRVTLRFGYMDSASIPRGLALARKLGWRFDIMSTSFLLSRPLLNQAARSEMPRWQDRLFIALARSVTADDASYFEIPSARLIEVGSQVLV